MIFNKQKALKILIGISCLASVFHLLILIKIIPYELTWGGRLKNDNEMYVFEVISIIINSFFIYILLQKGNYVTAMFSEKTLSVILWVFFAIFMLNSIGNLFAETILERSLTLLTLLNAGLIWALNRPVSRQ